MVNFHNKMLQNAYNDACGKTFTWSPYSQKFTDEHGNSDYDYHAMVWLKDNKWLVESFDRDQFVYLYKVYKVNEK